MKTPTQLQESIERYQESFWARRSAVRPPVGVYDEDIFLPIKFLRQPFARAAVEPGDVTGDLVASEYEFRFAASPVTCDDYIPFAAPWRGIPWLEAACGCAVRYSEGSLAPVHFVGTAEQLAEIPLPGAPAWIDCMRRETARLVAEAAPDCWVSPSILRGPSDALAAMRGMTNFFLDLNDNPQAVQAAAARVNQVLMTEIDTHYAVVEPRLGGYGHIFGYWSPGKTIMLQEDALGMCSPSVYRDIFMPLNAEIVRHLGAHCFFHLHTTGFKHYSNVMEIPGIAGVELTLETIGPTFLDLVPVMRQILERTRLIVHACTGFEYLPEVLRKVPQEGLLILVPSRYLPSDEAFRAFVRSNWAG